MNICMYIYIYMYFSIELPMANPATVPEKETSPENIAPKALLEGSWKLWEAIGRLLEDSWRALKGVSGLSCPREATTLPKGTTVKIKTRALGRL